MTALLITLAIIALAASGLGSWALVAGADRLDRKNRKEINQ